jgi:hypothetical protein
MNHAAQGTDAAAVLEQQRELNRAALKALSLALGNTMAEAVVHSPLSPRGVMYCAAIALRAFTTGARAVEGWTVEQAEAYLAEALADARADLAKSDAPAA